MGSVSSATRSDDEQNDSFDLDMSGFDISLLDDLLVLILSFVDAEDLEKNCKYVCKKWFQIIDEQSVWKEKCEREELNIPRVKFEKIPRHFYRKIYFHDPYGRNLLVNPLSLESWIIMQNGGDKFVVENPPNGSDEVPEEVGTQSCFATTYYPCEKYQQIDLLAEGISKEVLEMENTTIEIGEWFAARFDCAAEYRLTVTIADSNKIVLDKFDFEFREEQFVGRKWHKISHAFHDVGAVQYVLFMHYGKDGQFWAGHYGMKMTGSYMKVLVDGKNREVVSSSSTKSSPLRSQTCYIDDFIQS